MSVDAPEFCDTNVIVYAYSLASVHKRPKARVLLERLRVSGAGLVSVQVLQETFVTLIRKTSPPLSIEEAKAVVVELAKWMVVEPTRGDVLHAIDASGRWNISFWDAMLLTTARKGGASVLWSEDLNDGQSYDGVVVRNPFL